MKPLAQNPTRRSRHSRSADRRVRENLLLRRNTLTWLSALRFVFLCVASCLAIAAKSLAQPVIVAQPVSLTVNEGRTASNDFDGDGRSNLQEYRDGTDAETP